MGDSDKARERPSNTGGSVDAAIWVMSLLPVGVAFACYVGLILATGIEPKDRLIAYGAAAAFIGVECYWILRGLRDNHFGTMVTGFVGAALAILALDRYLSLV